MGSRMTCLDVHCWRPEAREAEPTRGPSQSGALGLAGWKQSEDSLHLSQVSYSRCTQMKPVMLRTVLREDSHRDGPHERRLRGGEVGSCAAATWTASAIGRSCRGIVTYLFFW